MTERMIVKGIKNNDYYFFDYPEDYEKEDGIGYVDVDNEVGFHLCTKSALYDDMSGYVDELQNEKELPEGRYIVTYYFFNSDCDLEQRVDFGISKNEIIHNVISQKYIEGADYFLIEQFIKY